MNATLYSAQALNSGDPDQYETATAYALRGHGQLMVGQLIKAIADFDASEEAYGRNQSSVHGRAWAFYLMGRDAGAWENADDLEDAITANEDWGMLQVVLGLVLDDLGDSRAEELFAEAASAPHPAGDYLIQYGAMAARGGSKDRAVLLLCTTHRLDQHDIRVPQAMRIIGLGTTACDGS